MSQRKRQRSPPLERSVTPLLQPSSAHKRRPSYLGHRSPSETSSISSIGSISAPPTPARISPAGNLIEKEEVCFVTIKDIQVLLKWEPKSIEAPKTQHELENVDSAFRVLSLRFHEGFCLLHIENGDAVGVLEDRALKILGRFAHEDSAIKLEAVVSSSQWQNNMLALPNQGRKGQPITVDIDVFGPRLEAQYVASLLGRGKLFLQRPCRRLLPPYENPQCLKVTIIPSVERHGTQIVRQNAEIFTSEFHEAIEVYDDNEIIDLDDLIDSILPHDYVEDVDVDHRVITPLRPYQKEAVQFISKRESGNGLEHRSLWDPLGTEQDAIGYRHAITGAKSRTADDCAGGILADAMGLGKTLTMITTIVGSLQKASDLAREKESEMKHASPACHSAFYHSKATLVVVPSELLLSSWTDEVQMHVTKDSINYHVYHGRDRTDDASLFCNYDIVLTTYGTLAADFGKGQGILHRTRWYRVILDEAHVIRNWSTKQFSAVNEIQAHIRWCMTGTPIQNRLEDLGSLVRFLGLPILGEPVAYRRYICTDTGLSKPTAKKDFTNLRLLLASICLRRTQTVLKLQSTTNVIRPNFSESEWDAYRTMEVICKQAIQVAVNTKKAKASHQNVLEKILRLREFCNGITANDSSSPEAVFSIMQQTGETCCAYCTADIKDLDAVDNARSVQLTECRRFICSDQACSHQYWREMHEFESRCPFCHLRHRTVDILKERDEHSAEPKKRQSYPTKLLALLQNVTQHASQEKCIVFSAWKRTLDIVEDLFNDHGIEYCRVDGSVSTTNQRKKILLEFQQNPDVKVLLMTLGTGAVGLNNLSVASQIHLLEPQWNPSVERQAIGRVLRLGQEKEVKILRYIMSGSIEEVVEGRQHHKTQIASGGFTIAQLAKEMHVESLGLQSNGKVDQRPLP
ncbi:DNA repair protein RAD5B [Paramyrothecium foliicola]|nr:DNA repair protein RAD5B [Paramyrothecium foliicola]